jgi:leucyl-tRNA synthetase
MLRWGEEQIYKSPVKPNGKKSYILDMFPYPSGEGLHVGHPKGYIATDIYSRFKRMNGFDVLHPMGWDAFGLPAEQYAIKNKIHPKVAVEKNVAMFKQQLSHLGLSYDWSREIDTTDPNFYKWTQWCFVKMFEKGLAFESYEPINWCPKCKTGLANEDLEGDTCERCDTVVEKKPIRQWVLKITDYADRLLQDLDTLDWPEGVKLAQKNWIGRSEGSEFDFKVVDGPVESVRIFTTRADTLFGATYVAISAELAQSWLCMNFKMDDNVKSYVLATLEEQKKETDYSAVKEKTGIFSGIYAINPANGEKLPIWIANYVLGGVGTGAIMAVPAHDERDYEFAKKYNLPFVNVIQPLSVTVVAIGKNLKDNFDVTEELSKKENRILEGEEVFVEDGTLRNSGKYNNLNSNDARDEIIKDFGGKKVVKYKIEDWVFARQRYWGEPFPIVRDKDGKVYAVDESELPVLLPNVESYEPTDTGESPLALISDWVNVKGYVTENGTFKQSADGELFTRETNTMPQWAGSSWYYLRFADPQNNNYLIDKEVEKSWLPVDVYVGGDHATRHLIYARFWHKFLYDVGVVSTVEPFSRLEFLGFILAEDGRKMSKRWGNVINPDDVVAEYGADTLRVYEMFMAPFEQTAAWSTSSIRGSDKFLDRAYALHEKCGDKSTVTTALHQTIKKVTEDIENFKFNTAVSQMMILVNAMEDGEFTRDDYHIFIQILAPFAPHLAEEIWSKMGQTSSVHGSEWPTYNEAFLLENDVTIAIQVGGKMRGTVVMKRDYSDEEAVEFLKTHEIYRKYVGEAIPKKIIVVKNRLVNVII